MGQQNTANTARSGVECSTITISIDGKYDDSKSVKVDDDLLKRLIGDGSNIGINEFFKLW